VTELLVGECRLGWLGSGRLVESQIPCVGSTIVILRASESNTAPEGMNVSRANITGVFVNHDYAILGNLVVPTRHAIPRMRRRI
jgi:hypothetical protein